MIHNEEGIQEKMKNRINHVFVLFSLFILVLTTSCQKQKAGWQGAIEYENGIKVISNPAQPLYGELTVELEDDLVLGSEEDDKYMFHQIGDIAVDSQGNIFVLDSGNQRLQKYDREGHYLQTIGRKGQGPGEFERPFNLFLDEQDNIFILELRKAHIFDQNGEFIKSFVPPLFIMDFISNPEGNFIVNGLLSSKQGQNFGIVNLDSEGKIVRTIAEFQGTRLLSRGGTTFSLSHEYSPFLSFSPIEKKGSVYGYNPEYKLFIINQIGETLFIIKKEESYHHISRAEKDKIIEDTLENTARGRERWPRDVVEDAANFPDHRPFFNGIAADDKGRIYVRRIKSVLDENEEVKFDIFGPDGHFLYTTRLSFTPRLIKGGYLYHTTFSEETGETKVIRYRIKNWAQMKTTI